MSDYTIIIFITKDTLQAFDVKDGKPVSIKGHTSMSYTVSDDIHAFNEYIKTYYNFEAYTDFPTAITLINCGAESAFVHRLFNDIKDAEQVNLVDAVSILPIIALTGGSVQKNSRKKYEVCGSFYEIVTDEHSSITCISAEKGGKAELIPPERFNVLFVLNAQKVGADETVLNALRAEKDGLLQKNSELEARIKVLQTEAEELHWLKRAIVAQVEKCKAEEERKQTEERVYRELKEVDKSICRAMFDKDFTVLVFSQIRQSGDIVSAGENIGKVYEHQRELDLLLFWGGSSAREMHAGRSGKIFYLKREVQKIKNGDAVAYIVDPKWTKAQALKWYEDNKDKLKLFDEMKRNKEKAES